MDCWARRAIWEIREAMVHRSPQPLESSTVSRWLGDVPVWVKQGLTSSCHCRRRSQAEGICFSLYSQTTYKTANYGAAQLADHFKYLRAANTEASCEELQMQTGKTMNTTWQFEGEDSAPLLVRPHLQSCVQLWNPQQEGHGPAGVRPDKCHEGHQMAEAPCL